MAKGYMGSANYYASPCIYQNGQLFIRSKNDILSAAIFKYSLHKVRTVSYTHLTLPTNREV